MGDCNGILRGQDERTDDWGARGILTGLKSLRENWKETAGPSTTLRSGRDDKGG
jgi:hypothetical protein